MRKFVCCVIVLALVFTFVTVSAESVFEDRSKNYNLAVSFAKSGMYDEALTLFSGLKTGSPYKDSHYWYGYCFAMVKINEADDFQWKGYVEEAEKALNEAKDWFSVLETVKFENAEQMRAYCEARMNYLKGMLQTAIDAFHDLYGVRDAWDYYQMLKENKALPTQAPKARYPDVLVGIPAKATKQINVYYGPGIDYKRITELTVNADSEIYLCASYTSNGNKWYLMETQTEKGKLRFWTLGEGRIYRSEDKSEPTVMKDGRETTLKTDAEVRFGPGEEYVAGAAVLPRQTVVTAYEGEGKYTLVSYKLSDADKTVCAWLPSDCLY